MKRSAVAIILVLSFCRFSAQVMWQFKKDSVVSWRYSQGDEFNSNAIDVKYWKYIGSVRSLFTNKEQQYYTDGENHYTSNGSLKLTAKKDTVVKRNIDWKNDDDSLTSEDKFYSLNKRKFNYTAGKLISQQTYNKGFFECRFKLPSQKGYWPAFWLYGGSPNEEIDIMEGKSEKTKQVHFDTHCANRCDYVNLFLQKRSYGGWVKTDLNFVEGFNVVGCLWDAGEVRFYLNGECVAVSKVKFDVDKHIAINIAVPANDGPFHPAPADEDTTTAIYEIDYVRVWQKESYTYKELPRSAFTDLDTLRLISTESITRSKGKLTYGKKSDHTDDGVFVSFFQNRSSIQVYALGTYSKTKPTYKLIGSDNTEVLNGTITKMISTLDLRNLKAGDYKFVVEYEGQRAEETLLIR